MKKILVLILLSFLFVGCGTPTNEFTFSFTYEYQDEYTYVPHCRKHQVKCYELKYKNGTSDWICPKCKSKPVEGIM